MDDAFHFADDLFLEQLLNEARRFRAKFPDASGTIAALITEVGSLTQAMLHMRDGKTNEWGRIHREAVQIAAIAMRCATEGDLMFGATPPAEYRP